MYYPREEKRDFLHTLSTLALIAILPLAMLALLSGQGAAVTLIAVNTIQAQATVTTRNEFPKQGVNLLNYEYAVDGKPFTGTYAQLTKLDAAPYKPGDSLAIVHSAFFPSVELPEASYAAGLVDAKVFTGCVAASLLLLGVSFFALVRQRKHAAEDAYY